MLSASLPPDSGQVQRVAGDVMPRPGFFFFFFFLSSLPASSTPAVGLETPRFEA